MNPEKSKRKNTAQSESGTVSGQLLDMPGKVVFQKQFPHVLAACLSLIVLLILFWNVFRTDMIFGSDILMQYYYDRAYGFAEMAKGNIPLWNPYQFCGYPFAGAHQSALFYPLNWIFCFFSVEKAFSISVFLHLWFAWFSMYLYVYHFTRKSFPSWTAGIVYMLSSVLLSRVYSGHITIVNTFPWLPLILLFLDKSLRDSKWHWACAGSLCFGMQILAGHPAMVFYTALGIVIYCAGWFWCSAQTNRFKNALLHSLMPGVIIGIGGGMVAAIQILPTLILSLNSVRSGGVTYEFATTFSFPPENFITYISPFFFGNMVDVPYWGRWYLWEIMPYIGIFPLAFLVMGGFTENRKLRFMAFLGLFSALIGMGGYTGFFKFVYRIVPGFSLFRGHARVFILLSFAGAASTGIWIDMLQKKEINISQLLNKAWKVLVGVAVLLLVILMISIEKEGGNSLFWRVIIQKSMLLGDRISEPTGYGSRLFLEQTYTAARGSLLYSFFMITAAAVVIKLLITKKKEYQKFLPYIICGLIVIDLLWVSGRYVKGTSTWDQRFPKKIVDQLQTESPVPLRIATSMETQDLSKGSLVGIAHAGGYDPAQLRRYVEYCNAMAGRPLDEELVISTPIRPGKMLKLMGVSHVLTEYGKPKYPRAVKVYSHEGIGTVYELAEKYPRAYIVHKMRAVPEKEKLLKELKRINPLHEALLEFEPGIELETKKRGVDETVSITEYSALRIAMTAETASLGLLVFTDTYYPLWKAKVNGERVSVIPVNHLFRGILLPEGTHDIEFYYDKSPFYLGLIVTILSIICLTGLIIVPLIPEKQEQEDLEKTPAAENAETESTPDE